jgi:hypothetical protein
MVVIGGLGSITGVFAGAIYLQGLSWSHGLFPRSIRPLLDLLGGGVGLIVVLMFLPECVGSVVYKARDNLLRRLADARGIVVPSLVADTLVTTEEMPEDIDLEDVSLAELVPPPTSSIADMESAVGLPGADAPPVEPKPGAKSRSKAKAEARR